MRFKEEKGAYLSPFCFVFLSFQLGCCPSIVFFFFFKPHCGFAELLLFMLYCLTVLHTSDKNMLKRNKFSTLAYSSFESALFLFLFLFAPAPSSFAVIGSLPSAVLFNVREKGNDGFKS